MAAHEVAAAARDDVGREAMGLEIAQELDHRQVDARSIGPLQRRVVLAEDERGRIGLDQVDVLARAGSEDSADDDPGVRVVALVVLRERGTEPVIVALVRRLPGLALAKGCVGRCLGGEAAEDVVELDRHRLLGPQGPVVVEYGDAFGRCHEIGSTRGRDAIDEFDDRASSGAVGPSAEDRHFGLGP